MEGENSIKLRLILQQREAAYQTLIQSERRRFFDFFQRLIQENATESLAAEFHELLESSRDTFWRLRAQAVDYTPDHKVNEILNKFADGDIENAAQAARNDILWHHGTTQPLAQRTLALDTKLREFFDAASGQTSSTIRSALNSSKNPPRSP